MPFRELILVLLLHRIAELSPPSYILYTLAPAVDWTVQENPVWRSNDPCRIQEEYGIVWNECNIYGKIYILIRFEKET